MVFVTFVTLSWWFNASRGQEISLPGTKGDARLAELDAWLEAIGKPADDGIRPASEDASFRRYFRLRVDGQTVIAMDAPPPQEDCRPFVQVAGYLAAMKLNAPRIIEADLERGFLLLTDLGSTSYLDALSADESLAERLYGDAIDALLRMQSGGREFQSALPPYDVALLERELALFQDWLCGTHLGIGFTAAAESAWRDTCKLLVDNALAQPRVFVHRDYHSRNLMLTDDDNPGIIDFQDAVEGPLSYDLVSLLKDCYIRWPRDRQDDWIGQFHAGLGAQLRRDVDEPAFVRSVDLMGVQRHLKAAGIFARLNHRDGKPGYMNDIPRTLSYILDLDDRYAELGFLTGLIRNAVLPALESSS